MSSLDRILPFLRPIEDLLRDPSVTEVMVNDGGQAVFVERAGRVEPVLDRTLEPRNLTVAIMFGNIILRKAGLPPFFVLPEHKREFNTVIAQAMAIETQPLVYAIYKTIKRELEPIASG